MSELDIVGRSHAHDSARQHVTGAAIYLDGRRRKELLEDTDSLQMTCAVPGLQNRCARQLHRSVRMGHRHHVTRGEAER